MVPWIDVINLLGFKVAYVKSNRMWTFGWTVGFSFRKFHICIGVVPTVRDDYELS